tara:strand:+ start:115 stop:267 length:153 start_codon:yes stop_codon:yes gene_type:complete
MFSQESEFNRLPSISVNNENVNWGKLFWDNYYKILIFVGVVVGILGTIQQ